MTAVRQRESFVEVPPTRLNPTDATLWDIERNPALRTTIVAAIVLDRHVDRAHLLNVLEAATRRVPKLRQRVVENLAGVGVPHWEIDPRFDLAEHVSFVDAPGAVDEAAIASVAEPMASSPFDRGKPLWECTYIAGSSARSALVLKIHHALTDGVGGIGLLDVAFDRCRDTPPRDLSTVPIPTPGRASGPAPDAVDRAVNRWVGLPFDVASTAATAAFHPRRAINGLWESSRSAGRLLAPSTTPLSKLMAGRSLDRHVGVADVDLDRLRRAAARHGCTINHAFFASAIDGIGAYHRELGTPTKLLRVTMPVSLRRPDHEHAGNQWAPVRFVVPTDVADPIERMHAMAALAQSARRERALSFSQSLAGMVQVLPSVLSSWVVAGMMHGVDVTLTNVPGLTEPHYLAGAAVERIYGFAPTAGAALNVGLVSHLGTACIGMLSDAAAVSDPHLLQRMIAAGLDDLIVAAEARPPTPPSTATPGPSAAPERLSALDTAFLRLESHDTPMHIGAAFVLDGGPLRDAGGAIRIGDIRRHVEARIRRVARFTRRIAEVPFGVGRPLWVDDEDFDIRRHVRLTRVAEPGDLQALLDRCAELFREPLDRAHPLWELWLVEGMAGGGIGIVEKLHHALVDGVGGVEFAAALFDVEPVAAPDTPVRTTPSPGPSAPRRLADALAWQLADPVRVVSHTVSSLARSPERFAGQVGNAVAAAGELIRRGARAPRVGFNQPVGDGRVIRAVTFDLGEIHAVRAAVRATVNDVVLATVTGGMRTWFRATGQQPVDVHVLVPVSVREDSIGSQLGNHVGGVMVALPVAEPDPVRRLEIVQSRMRRLKAAHEGEGAAVVLDALDHVPALGYRAVSRLVAAQPFVNFVVTNVPGSPVPLHLLGARIETIVPVVPLGPGLGLGIAILTYADHLTISVSADPELCPDAGDLTATIADELGTLGAALGVA